MTRHLRFAAFTSAVALAALALIALPAVSLAPTDRAAADTPTCIAGYFDVPNLKGAPRYGTDAEVGTYIGGNLSVSTGASEIEGKFVIAGSATFNSGAYFNVGVVGAGSQVTPGPMTDMLVTGANVVVGGPPNYVEVGNLIGGNIVAGGTVTGGGPSPTAFVNTNGGTITEGAVAPLAPYASVATHYQALSASYAAITDSGVVNSDSGTVNFIGNGVDPRQVFTVDGADLGAIGATKSMIFTNIPADAVVIVNVTGTTPVVSANSFSFSTTLVPGPTVVPGAVAPDRTFSHFTQSLLWNFPTATNVTLGDQDQLLGSILVPTASSNVTLLTSTNGRIYVNGNVTLGGSTQSGLEIHNYPFREECVVTPTVGSLSITKTVTDPDSVVDALRTYTGSVVCDIAGTDVSPTPNTWSITAGGAPWVFNNIPATATCTVTEDSLTAPPSALDSSYRWQAAVYSPATATIVASAASHIEVQNSVRRALGSLELVKVLDDPFNVVSLNRVYTGTFQCTHNSVDVTPAPGTWSTTAGAPAITLATNLPAGTQCSVTEDALTAPPLAGSPQYQWRAPAITPTTITITDGVTSRFTVTNTVFDPFDVLASTGSEVALPLWLGGGALAGGLLVVFLGYWRRRAARH
jgi:choice-of-anchor A domain-containing protein